MEGTVSKNLLCNEECFMLRTTKAATARLRLHAPINENALVLRQMSAATIKLLAK